MCLVQSRSPAANLAETQMVSNSLHVRGRATWPLVVSLVSIFIWKYARSVNAYWTYWIFWIVLLEEQWLSCTFGRRPYSKLQWMNCSVGVMLPVKNHFCYVGRTTWRPFILNSLDSKKIKDEHRHILISCQEDSYRLTGSQASSGNTKTGHVISLAALDVLWQNRDALRSHSEGLLRLLRGSSLMFPKRSL